MKRDLPAYCYRKGKRGYIYFIRGVTCARITAQPGSPEFAVEYARLLAGRVQTSGRTLDKLIEHYHGSSRWAKLASNTRKSYERHLEYFSQAAGSIDPASLRRVHIIQMRDALADKPTDANRKISTLSVLFEHGIDIGWLNENPAKGVQSIPTQGRVRQPWPAEMVEAFRRAAPPRTALIFELLIGTGQRINDVLDLRWSDLSDGAFTLTQGKTKKRLYIPLTERLQEVLANTPRHSLYIVAQNNGLRVSYNLAWKDFMTVREEIGARDYDIHGLRYTAASEIAAIPGMTAEHVKAITGHAQSAMVHLYAGAAMQKARASEAQKARGDRTGTKPEF